MSKTLLFLFFCLTLNYSHSMYVIPNEVVVERGTNYSFQVVTSLPFDKYTLNFDTDSIAFNARRNSTHITVDYDVPNIMKLRIYSCFIETLDHENYVLENATYYFVIGNLTEMELYALFQTNEDLEEVIGTINKTFNDSNISAWLDYEYPKSLFEKNFKYIIIIGTTLGTCLSFFGVALAQQKHKAKEKIKEKEAKAKKAKKNFAKAQLTKQAVSHSMNIYVAKNIDGEIVYVKLLNEWELESCEKYEKNYDASFFLRPTKEMEDKLDKKDKKKITSIDVIYYRLKEHLKSDKEEPNYSEWWYVFSAIVKYLQEKGHIKKNNDLFPVRCTLKKIRKELGKVYIEKDKQDFKGLEDEKKEDDTQKKFDKAVEKSKKAPKPNAKTKDTTNVHQIDVDKKLKDKFNTI